jgi:hypothetical protein
MFRGDCPAENGRPAQLRHDSGHVFDQFHALAHPGNPPHEFDELPANEASANHA